MPVGYARTSTIEQQAGFDAQLRDLEGAGCEKVFREQVSSVAQRDQLEAVLEFIGTGDTLVVTKLDRLARSTADLLKTEEQLQAKGAALKVLDLDLDTSTATGKLVAAIGAFERELMLERQREGIAKAKAEGKYKGRKPTARAKADQVKAMRSQGIGATAIAKKLEIGRASVYRILSD
jgi:DNA invertase Pin-like site-specific DNA recombinase